MTYRSRIRDPRPLPPLLPPLPGFEYRPPFFARHFGLVVAAIIAAEVVLIVGIITRVFGG